MRFPLDSCAALTGAIRQRYPAHHEIQLAFGKCTVEVRLDNLPLFEKLARYFKPFLSDRGRTDLLVTVHQAEADFAASYTVKEPDPGKTKIKEEYVDLPDGRLVRKRLTGMHFLFGRGNNLAIGPCLENDNQVVNFINNRFIEWKLKQGSLLCHAAGVRHNGRGLALAGFSGMGKSTLALHLMSRGTCFVSNDRLLVDKTGLGCTTMSGVAKLPRVNPGTVLHNPDLSGVIPDAERSRFANLNPTELWTLEHKFDADIEACFGPGRFVLGCPLSGLVILNWQRGGGPVLAHRVKLDERPDLLPAFMKEPGLFYLPQRTGPATFPAAHYLDRLRQVPVIELGGGTDFDTAADLCMDFLEND